jgi:sugar (pentulose or hexulose) kinase
VDDELDVLGPVVMVSDRRAGTEAAEISASPEFTALASAYGMTCNVYSQIARMKWFRDREPEVCGRTRWWLSPNDYLLAKLSGGEVVTDTLIAGKALYVPAEKRYASECFDAFGLDVAGLPRVVEPGTPLGTLDAAVAARLRINPRARLVVTTYDAICSVFGTGVCEPGMACDVSGTVTSVRMYTDTAFRDPEGRVFCQPYPPTNGYVLGGSNNLGGGLVEWVKQCFYKNEEHPYLVMEEEAARSHGSTSGLVFLPHLLGARAPTWNSEARGVFFGLERHHSRGDLVRAVFESMGYSIREFVEIFKEIGHPVELITASGGLARISLANELKANISGVPYHVMDDFESTALGAAVIALAAVEHYGSYGEACRAMVRTRKIFLPTSRNRAYYDEMFQFYQEVAAASAPLFSRRAEIIRSFQVPSVDHIENL